MNGIAPAAAIISKLVFELYPLSPDTSMTLKFRAVVANIGERSLVSAAFGAPISMAVTMLVLTPHMRWTLTHSCCFCCLPYLWSNQRLNLEVVKPDESAAKSTSIAFKGRALRSTRERKIGVRLSFSSTLKIVL